MRSGTVLAIICAYCGPAVPSQDSGDKDITQLVRQLSSDSIDLRDKAHAKLLDRGSSAAHGLLRKHFLDEDVDLRDRARKILTHIGPHRIPSDVALQITSAGECRFKDRILVTQSDPMNLKGLHEFLKELVKGSQASGGRSKRKYLALFLDVDPETPYVDFFKVDSVVATTDGIDLNAYRVRTVSDKYMLLRDPKASKRLLKTKEAKDYFVILCSRDDLDSHMPHRQTMGRPTPWDRKSEENPCAIYVWYYEADSPTRSFALLHKDGGDEAIARQNRLKIENAAAYVSKKCATIAKTYSPNTALTLVISVDPDVRMKHFSPFWRACASQWPVVKIWYGFNVVSKAKNRLYNQD